MTPIQGTLQIGKKHVTYRVRRGASEKYINMGFTNDLELEIILPRNGNVDTHDLLRKKRAWIENRYKELSRSKRVYNNGKVLYKGRYLTLQIIKGDQNHVELNRDGINIIVNHSDPHYVLEEWMHRQTKNYVTKQTKKYSNKLNVSYNKIYVRNMNKWGSCSQKGNLTFNTFLVALPLKLAEYVVAHEVMHLLEFNHTIRFKHRLERLCSDINQKEKQLHIFIPTL